MRIVGNLAKCTLIEETELYQRDIYYSKTLHCSMQNAGIRAEEKQKLKPRYNNTLIYRVKQ